MSCELNLLEKFGKQFTKKDINEILKHAEAVIKSKKGVQNFSELMEYVIKKRVEHLKNRERYLKQIEKKNFIDARLTEFSKITKFTKQNAMDLLESFLSRNGKYQQNSLDTNIVAKYNQYMSMVQQIEKEFPEYKLLKDPEANPEVTKMLIREIYNLSKNGETSNTAPPAIREMAKKFHDINQQRLADLQSQGFDINDLEGYIYSGAYDPELVRTAGINRFAEAVSAHVDIEETAKKWGIDLTSDKGSEELSKMIRDIYETISTKDTSFIHKSGIEDVFEEMKNPSRMQHAVSRGRVFSFKDADSFHAFFTEFSGKSFLEAVHRDIRRSAKAYATAEIFGTSPIIGKEFMFRKVNELLVENGQQPLGLTYKKFYDNMFDFVAGNTGLADNLAIYVAANTKKITDMALLGKAPLKAVLTDPVFSALEQSKISHDNFYVAYAKSISNFVTNIVNPAHKAELAKRFGYLSKAVQMETIHDRTLGAGPFTRGVTAAHDAFMRMTMINGQATNMRLANMTMTAQHIADTLRGKTGKWQLKDMEVLKRYGFNDTDFSVMMNALSVNKKADMIDPSMIRDLDEATLRTIFPEKKKISRYNEDLDALESIETDYDLKDLKIKAGATAQKLSAYLHDSAFLGSPTPTKVTTFYLSGMSSPETVTGSLMQLITMYKSFPLTVYRVLKDNAWRDGVDRGGFFKQYGRSGIMNTMLLSLATGGAALMVSDILDGKTPRDPTSEGFIFDAFMAGGAGGLFADYLLEEYEQGKKDIVRDMAGPVVGRMLPDIMELYKGLKENLIKGDEKAMTQTFINLSRWVPAQNLWISNALFGNMVLNNYRKWVDPKFERRRRKNMKEMSGQLWQQKQYLK